MPEAPPWAGPAGAVMGATGAKVFQLGLRSGMAPVMVAGTAISATGMVLVGWTLLSPPATIDHILNSPNMQQIQQNYHELQRFVGP